jgi:predicted DsbA family dithiol-disulfide isomerase
MAALGRQEGIRFAFERMERTPNTRQAHCLIAHASRQGRGPEVVEALFTAYFEEALDIGREETLAQIGVGLGLDEAAVRAALQDDELRASVVDIEQEAGRLGIGGVPFFIIDEKWSVSGAQSTEVWLEALRRLHDRPAEVHGA